MWIELQRREESVAKTRHLNKPVFVVNKPVCFVIRQMPEQSVKKYIVPTSTVADATAFTSNVAFSVSTVLKEEL